VPNRPIESKNSRAPLVSKTKKKRPNLQQDWRKGRGRKPNYPKSKQEKDRTETNKAAKTRSEQRISLSRACGWGLTNCWDAWNGINEQTASTLNSSSKGNEQQDSNLSVASLKLLVY
jgi:hypothetical protein